jgi:acyl-CoA-binding protein
MRRPLSPASIDRSLKVAYGLIVRERRRYFRCPVEILAAIHRPGMLAVHGRTLNISEGGLAINTSLSLKPGAPVKLQFTLPDHATQFETEATVCWAKEGYLGFQFTSLSAQRTTELQEWLARRLEETFPESVADKFRSLEQAEQSSASIRESQPDSNLALESQIWVSSYRAAVSEPDAGKRPGKIELAERSMKQRWSELAVSGPEAAEERLKLIDALKNLARLRSGPSEVSG